MLHSADAGLIPADKPFREKSRLMTLSEWPSLSDWVVSPSLCFWSLVSCCWRYLTRSFSSRDSLCKTVGVRWQTNTWYAYGAVAAKFMPHPHKLHLFDEIKLYQKIFCYATTFPCTAHCFMSIIYLNNVVVVVVVFTLFIADQCCKQQMQIMRCKKRSLSNKRSFTCYFRKKFHHCS